MFNFQKSAVEGKLKKKLKMKKEEKVIRKWLGQPPHEGVWHLLRAGLVGL
jgi:hypothetical protein